MAVAGVLPERALSFRSPTPEHTRAVAADLARAWWARGERAGVVVGLLGGLGVGKTAFVKGLAEGLGLDGDAVSSPTFVLANQYVGTDGASLHHVDFYRIELAAELEEMGFFDLMAPAALLAVEWADRFDHALPRQRIEIRIEREAGSARRFAVRAWGDVPCAIVDAWRDRAGLGGD